MPSFSQTLIMGHLGRDPELRQTPGGASVANMSVATTRTWKDKQTGNKQEQTEWHRVVLWGRQAEVAEEYLSKGDCVQILGENRTRKWQDKEGNDRYTTEVHAAPFNGLTMVSTKGKQSSQSDQGEEWPPYDQDIPF